MAMTQCPKCGKEISDKARKCIHCGEVFVEEKEVNEEIKCSECSAILSETDEICPNCGCPVERQINETEIKPQQVEVASIKMAAKTKKIIFAIILVAALCVGGGIGYKVYSDTREEQIYREAYNEYIDHLGEIQILMLSGASNAESLCNLTLKVWGNTIFEERDSETDKYTRPDGYFVSDFNEALLNLYSDSSTTDKISNIKSNQTSVKDLIKKLQDPPKGLEKCYDTVSDLYEAYKILTDLALNPSGSYRDFGSKKSEAVSDFMSPFEKLDNQIPEKLK